MDQAEASGVSGFQMKLYRTNAQETREEADSRFEREESLLNDVMGIFKKLDRDRSTN